MLVTRIGKTLRSTRWHNVCYTEFLHVYSVALYASMVKLKMREKTCNSFIRCVSVSEQNIVLLAVNFIRFAQYFSLLIWTLNPVHSVLSTAHSIRFFVCVFIFSLLSFGSLVFLCDSIKICAATFNSIGSHWKSWAWFKECKRQSVPILWSNNHLSWIICNANQKKKFDSYRRRREVTKPNKEHVKCAYHTFVRTSFFKMLEFSWVIEEFQDRFWK